MNDDSHHILVVVGDSPKGEEVGNSADMYRFTENQLVVAAVPCLFERPAFMLDHVWWNAETSTCSLCNRRSHDQTLGFDACSVEVCISSLISSPPQRHVRSNQQIYHLQAFILDDQFAQLGSFPSKTSSSILLPQRQVHTIK